MFECGSMQGPYSPHYLPHYMNHDGWVDLAGTTVLAVECSMLVCPAALQEFLWRPWPNNLQYATLTTCTPRSCAGACRWLSLPLSAPLPKCTPHRTALAGGPTMPPHKGIFAVCGRCFSHPMCHLGSTAEHPSLCSWLEVYGSRKLLWLSG
jgi:hypothetical protein